MLSILIDHNLRFSIGFYRLSIGSIGSIGSVGAKIYNSTIKIMRELINKLKEIIVSQKVVKNTQRRGTQVLFQNPTRVRNPSG